MRKQSRRHNTKKLHESHIKKKDRNIIKMAAQMYMLMVDIPNSTTIRHFALKKT